MRVIYVVRAAQLLMVLRALFLLYSVSAFCERTQHTAKACSDMVARIPFATPEQIAEFKRAKALRAASARAAAVKNMTGASSTHPVTTTKTAHEPASAHGATVTAPNPSPTEEVKIRRKRDERRELPGNGMTEAQRKAAATKDKKVEKKEEAKETKPTGPITEDKKVEAAFLAALHTEKKLPEGVKAEEIEITNALEALEAATRHEEKLAGHKAEQIEIKNAVEALEEATRHEEKQEPGHKAEEIEIRNAVEALEEATHHEEKQEPGHKAEEIEIRNAVEALEEATRHEEKQEPDHKAEEIEIRNAVEALEEATRHEEKQEPGHKAEEIEIRNAVEALEEATRHEEKQSEHSEKHHTVKKDLKAHVQEQPSVKESWPPKLAPEQKTFVLEHSDAFLQEVRCLEVTSDDYFGKQASPFAEHLRGLAFCGPVLVVIAVYLVCSVMRTRLSHEANTEFTDTLFVVFHAGMWTVVALSMLFIVNHWTDNWHTVSNNTFLPEFPCAWTSLMLLASFMMVATSVEAWFLKRLNYDIVFERSYRIYEVIDNSEAGHGHDQFSRTNVY